MLSISTRTLDRLCQQDLVRKVYVAGAVRFRLNDILSIVNNGI